MARICMVLRGDIRYDGRVRKEIATLHRYGHAIELIVSDFTGMRLGGDDLGVPVHYLHCRISQNPAANFADQILFSYKAARIARRLRPTHIHCHNLQGLLAGVWAKRTTNAKIVFDAHELMPESLDGARRKVWDLIERRSIFYSDHILMPESNRIAYFENKYVGIPKPVLLQNLPRRDDIPQGTFDVFRETYPITREQTIVLYTGLIAPGRCVDELIEALMMCDPRFVLVVLGFAYKNYAETLKQRIKELDLSNRVFLHDPVPNTEIIKYMASCDIGVALYRNTDINNYFCAPNKVYEYIALGKPIITNDYPGLVEAVKKHGQGICTGSLSPTVLAESCERAADRSVVKGGRRKCFWEEQEGILLKIYGGSVDQSRVEARQWWMNIEKPEASRKIGA